MKYTFVFFVICTSCHSLAPVDPTAGDAAIASDAAHDEADEPDASADAMAAEPSGNPLDDLTAGRGPVVIYPVLAANDDGGYDDDFRGRVEAANAYARDKNGRILPAPAPPATAFPASQTPRPPCDPPWFLDAEGHKSFKRECL